MKVGEPLVIQAKQVQDGRVKIVGVNRIDHGLEANLIGAPVRVTGLTAGHHIQLELSQTFVGFLQLLPAIS